MEKINLLEQLYEHLSSNNLLKRNWESLARYEQKEPNYKNWNTWLILAGRGFGKTRTGSETVLKWVRENRYKNIAIIGRTIIEARQVMVEGESGILNCCFDNLIINYNKQDNIIKFKNGCVIKIFGGDNYERLRGPQFDAAWVDELAKFKNANQLWEQLQLCLRLGKNPKCIVTTTPRKSKLLKNLLSDDLCVVTRGSTFDNSKNLAPSFIENIKRQFVGTRLEAQEVYAKVLDEADGALWNRNLIAYESPPSEEWKRVIIAVDPALTDESYSDETGIVVVGLHANNKAYVLEDASLKAKPKEWIQNVAILYKTYNADRVVAEINKGGDLVYDLLKSIDPHIAFKGVRATRGKVTRAEPVVSLYEQGKIAHKFSFEDLENQLCTYIPEQSKKSPDRLDALVWGLTDLFLLKEASHEYKVWV